MLKLFNMFHPVYIFLGLAPSIIWLLFYLRKDAHPEPKRQVIKIFFYGMLAAVPAIFLEKGILEEFNNLNIAPFLIVLLNTFIAVALVEEFIKYLVVKGKVLNNQEFDEPVDAMLYMIIAALGFAAFENILILLPLSSEFLIKEALVISAFRFLGATFLHTLCSATVGFFLALSFFETKKRIRHLATGLIIAVLLHGLYNFAITNPDLIYRPFSVIMKTDEGLNFLIPLIILIGLAVFVFSGFKKLKKMKSVCKI